MLEIFELLLDHIHSFVQKILLMHKSHVKVVRIPSAEAHLPSKSKLVTVAHNLVDLRLKLCNVREEDLAGLVRYLVVLRQVSFLELLKPDVNVEAGMHLLHAPEGFRQFLLLIIDHDVGVHHLTVGLIDLLDIRFCEFLKLLGFGISITIIELRVDL